MSSTASALAKDFQRLQEKVVREVMNKPTYEYMDFKILLRENGDMEVGVGENWHLVPRSGVFDMINRIISDMTPDPDSKIPKKVQLLEKEKTVSSLRRHIISLEPVVKSIELE
jgi:hypothetical protein